MDLEIFTTGGTIDKVYFDARSTFEVGESQILEVLREANLALEYRVTALLRLDSLDMSEEDRRLVREAVANSAAARIVVTHGTDTMIDTAKILTAIPAKTIVLTGAMQPARFRATDAVFNIGAAITATRVLPAGVYIAMHGRLFDPWAVRKNPTLQRFEEI